MFNTPLGKIAAVTEQAKLLYNEREPAQTMDIVRRLKQISLLSISKFADKNYFMLFTSMEVKIFNGEATTIAHSKEAIL